MNARPILCQQCGAALTPPPDLYATTMRCAYCGRENPLPHEMVMQRREQVQQAQQMMMQAQAAQQQQAAVRSSMSIAKWITIVTVLPGLIGGAIAVYFSVRATSAFDSPSFEAPAPVEVHAPARVPTISPVAVPAAPPVAAAPRKPPKDPKLVEQRMTAMMREKYNAGCKNVLLAPKKTAGTSTSKATLSKNAFCFTLLAVSSADDNKLTLTMTTPLGEKVATPPASTEIAFSYCAQIDGPYPIEIEPQTDDFYMMGSVDCPASLVNAKKK